MLANVLNKVTAAIDAERTRIKNKYKLDTDRMEPVRVENKSDGSLILSGGFACNIGVLPEKELKAEGYVDYNGSSSKF